MFNLLLLFSNHQNIQFPTENNWIGKLHHSPPVPCWTEGCWICPPPFGLWDVCGRTSDWLDWANHPTIRVQNSWSSKGFYPCPGGCSQNSQNSQNYYFKSISILFSAVFPTRTGAGLEQATPVSPPLVVVIGVPGEAAQPALFFYCHGPLHLHFWLDP